MGNRTSVVENGVTKNYTTVDHNLLTAAGDAAYTYDSLGNTTSKTVGTDVWTYQYDEENRLRKVLLNGVVIGDYWYDAGGMRVRTVADGVTICYVNNGVSVLQEDNVNTGERTDYVFAGTIRIAAKKSGVVKYFHADHLGSTRVMTNEAGVWTAKYKYDVFGKMITQMGTDETKYKFSGKQEDIETGLSYFARRYYEKETGRFMTIDPIKDGRNYYQYCISNPLRYIDTNGLAPGDPFASPEEAARDFAQTYWDDTTKGDIEHPSGHEFGSSIYAVDEDHDGNAEHYTYTVPNRGSDTSVSCSVPDPGYEVVATIHTHPSGNPDFSTPGYTSSTNFSSDTSSAFIRDTREDGGSFPFYGTYVVGGPWLNFFDPDGPNAPNTNPLVEYGATNGESDPYVNQFEWEACESNPGGYCGGYGAFDEA